MATGFALVSVVACSSVSAGSGATFIAASSALALRNNPASLGTVEMKGGTVSVEFLRSALGTAGNPDITGVIKNANSGTVRYADVTITVTGKDDPPSPTPHGDPHVGGTTVSKGSAGSTSGGEPGSVPNGQQTEHQTLPGGEMPSQDSLDVAIDMDGLGNADKIVVSFTPSAANKPVGSNAHANVLENFELAGGHPGRQNVCAWTTHDRLVFQVINADPRDPIIEIVGQVTFPPGSGLSLGSVSIQNPDDGHAPFPNAAVSVSGNDFTITGLNLGTARRAEIVTAFSSEPAVGTSVSVNVAATFD